MTTMPLRPAPGPGGEVNVGTLEAAELAAALLAGFTLIASWFYGLRMAFTTHRIWGAVYPLDNGFQDHQLFRTDLGAGLAVVGLGTLLAALAAIVYVAIHTLLKPHRVARRQAERARLAALSDEGL